MSSLWYIFDQNTESYILRDLDGKDDPDFWSAHSTIRIAFAGVPFDEDICPGLFVGQSVTECEVQFILSNPERIRRARWLRRNFLGVIPDAITREEKDKALSDGSYNHDASSRLQELLQRMTHAFEHNNDDPDAVKCYEISTDAYAAETGPSNPEKQAYLDEWKRDVTAMLTNEVSKIIQEKNQWSLDGCGLGVHGDDVAEMLHHYSWAREKCSDFEGREDLIGQAMQCIQSENRTRARKNKGSSEYIIYL